jgi:putative transcriptional regulator
MKTKGIYKSDALEAAHSAVAGMYRAGTIDIQTMRSFDESCLVDPEISPEEIRLLREENRVSQPVFAHQLNVSESTVQKWSRSPPRLFMVNIFQTGLQP